MSWNPSLSHAVPDAGSPDAIETVIVPRTRDIGGFEVRRALPSARRQMVGPFIFFDQFGPAEFLTGQGIDVLPHPHIGLATVTYLFRGEFQHRDSLGSNQMIHPGAVNWMIAGNGVTHSERTSAETRKNPSSLFGIQTWVALPESAEEDPASFEHHSRETLPFLQAEGKQVRLIVGRAYGETAPVRTHTDMFYCDCVLERNAVMPLPSDHEDRGAYILEGSVTIAGDVFEAGRMMVFRPGDEITIRAGETGARVLLLGGETLNGPRYIWWTFVASSRERIDRAKQDWQRGQNSGWQDNRFTLPPGDDSEFVPIS